jgi:hypothetical protein
MHGLQWDYSFPRSPHGEVNMIRNLLKRCRNILDICNTGQRVRISPGLWMYKTRCFVLSSIGRSLAMGRSNSSTKCLTRGRWRKIVMWFHTNNNNNIYLFFNVTNIYLDTTVLPHTPLLRDKLIQYKKMCFCMAGCRELLLYKTE